MTELHPRPLLSVQKLGYFALNGDELLRDVSFDLNEGAILAVTGPNGAGKTTLLNLLSGLGELALGDVIFDGQSLRDMTTDDRAHAFAVVSQLETPDPRLRVQDYVALGQIPIRHDCSSEDLKADLDRLLDSIGLTHLAMKPMGQLSGGERQRAHIARALAQKPRVLFLDEPTNHLDPDAKVRMLSLVAALGITVVMILHDLVMIPEFATHVAMLKNGQLAAFGTVEGAMTEDLVRDTFGVSLVHLPHEGRIIPALDLRRQQLSR